MMFCPNCGKKNPDDSRFCEGCGANMLEPGTAATPPPAPQAQPQQQPVYAPPVQPAYNPVPQAQYSQQAFYPAADLSKPLSIGGFMATYLVLAIPLVNLIMLFVWAFGSNTNINRKNLCRAILIFAVIGIVLSIVIGIVFAGFWPSIMDQLSGYGYY